MLDITHRLLPLAQGGHVLCLKCAGTYEIGAAGHPQAKQIYEAAVGLLRETDADCLLLDYSELDYQWGDDMWRTFQFDHPKDPNDIVTHAVIVGPGCSSAIKSLLEEDGGCDSWLDVGWVFFREVEALDYLAQKVPASS